MTKQEKDKSTNNAMTKQEKDKSTNNAMTKQEKDKSTNNAIFLRPGWLNELGSCIT
jgi:hypothetical protein